MGRATKVCERCGSNFARNRHYSRAQWQAARFCSSSCFGHKLADMNAASRAPLRERFEERVKKGPECWEWTGTIDGYGYGVIDHDMKRYRAHVLALEFDGRPVQSGMMACHHCDNPKCVRPDHLYPGTPADNARDAKDRNRMRVGSGHGMAKLTEGDVLRMRAMFTGRHGDLSRIARSFGVTRPTAAKAIKGKNWKHVT